MFSRLRYEAHDPPARKASRSLLTSAYGDRFVIVDNPDIYGVDLLVSSALTSERLFDLEVEMKLDPRWTDRFPFPTLRFMSRKSKIVESSFPTVFLTFNRDLTRYASTTSEVLRTSGRVESSTTRGGFMEFISLDVSLVDFDDIATTVERCCGGVL